MTVTCAQHCSALAANRATAVPQVSGSGHRSRVPGHETAPAGPTPCGWLSVVGLDGPSLRPVDAALGTWVEPRLSRRIGSVTSLVPAGFAAYLRLAHPVGLTSTWAQVCEVTGQPAHSLMQFSTIRQPASAQYEAWRGPRPTPGDTGPHLLRRTLDVLAADTSDSECVFALWVGHGWIRGGTATAVLVSGVDDPSEPHRSTPPMFGSESLKASRLRLPMHDYVLLGGGLRAAMAIGWRSPDGDFFPQSPNLMWPADHGWFIATDPGHDSTVIGGGMELIDRVLVHAGLEAWPVASGDILLPAD